MTTAWRSRWRTSLPSDAARGHDGTGPFGVRVRADRLEECETGESYCGGARSEWPSEASEDRGSKTGWISSQLTARSICGGGDAIVVGSVQASSPSSSSSSASDESEDDEARLVLN